MTDTDVGKGAPKRETRDQTLMKPISAFEEFDQEGARARIDEGTHTVEDQVWLLNQAIDIALSKLMDLAIEVEQVEEYTPTVADVVTLVILSAPLEEREKLKNEILAEHLPGILHS